MNTLELLRTPELLFDYLRPEDVAFYDITTLPTEDELPCDDGVPMETQRHHDQMQILIESLKAYWKNRQDYYVGGDMFLHFDPLNRRSFRGPDVFLVLNTDSRERKSWVVWQENMRYPDVIIELLSPSTRQIDKVDKKHLYEQVFKTSEYYLYDPFSQEFMGYSLRRDTYVPVQPDSARRIFSPTTGLALMIHNERLRWATESGMILPTGLELADQEKQRADQERQRAEHERQRADQERRRADQSETLLMLEKQRSERLVARLRELGVLPNEPETS